MLAATAAMHEHVLQADQAVEMRPHLEVAPPREAADVAPGEAIGGPGERLTLAGLAHHRVEQAEQPAGLRHTAQMIDMALRTGMMQNAAGRAPASFRDVMQMAPEEAEAALMAKPTGQQRLLQALGQLKHAACFPLAVAALPYVRARGYKGTYLYCLARLRD